MRIAARWAAGILVLDQITKFAVVQVLGLKDQLAIDVIPPWLNFRMAWNQGVNFGLFSGETELTRWVLIALALAISLWVWRWISREPVSFKVQVSAGFLIGGALGNVIDRVAYGAVADFINMSLPGWQNPFSFNVADIAIFAGAAGLALFTTGTDRATTE
ncbi:signal peptidase II [Thioclava sp. SK-1]|uniref:signal peptidase II n=1 Tax=Thioclava sp. SK-1 TaxID=1889770 RepID=UPI000824D45B|nr:signal peptidase II [Thioclava sp. SK-1]OCX65802.1 signal peptidase II [Thioclava sp. SK-1]